jgi:uncharacterized protein (TIGR02996 family)
MAGRKLNAAHHGPDAVALLRTICAEPDEDSPRLVYADLIEENGDAARACRPELRSESSENSGVAP